MTKHTNKKAETMAAAAVAAHNARIRAEHARIRAEILALRPEWSAEKLEAIAASYGPRESGLPTGLHDILIVIRTADALAAKFA